MKRTGGTPWLRCDELALIKLYPHEDDALLARVFGRTEPSIAAKARNMGLKKSAKYLADVNARCRFQKGIVPANKGTRRPGYAPGRMGATQFKKGHRPHTWVPIGSYRVVPDGYVQVKFSNEPGPYMKRWIDVHRQVWEAAHGPVPRGHKVCFKPGRHTTDPKLITLDALELRTNAEHLAKNSVHRYGPEIFKLVQLRGVLKRQINQRAKEGE